ncbi:hypothetical protein OPQ81_011392 [Rhizoctonia solani]|nr:hypothetical protein OPQ81_009102 [Rhizoctonia solani]KAJ1303193.1 hypothetical protein OPQ81_011392 [Rhizoctonia solani]
MANYTTSVERPGNVLVEAFGAETSSDNTPDATPQIHQSRTPPQNSTGSLPEYHEQAPVGEVVLLEPVRHGSMADSDDDDRNRDETGGTLSIGVVLPYTDSGQTSEPPRTIISSRSGTSSLGSLQDRSANLGFDATTTASSMGVTGPEYARTTEAGILEVITNTTASSYGDVPTYEESTAVALSHTIDITEAMDGPTRVDQG